VPSPAASIAAASAHLIRRNRGSPLLPIVVGRRTVCHPLLCNLRRCRHHLAEIVSVAAGLRFAMHNNQPEAEAAQWRRQRGILRVDAVPRDTQYLPQWRLKGVRFPYPQDDG